MGGLLGQIAKFGLVGVIATAIDFGVMNLLHYGLGLGVVLSNTAGFCVSVAFNYLASMRYVFTHRQDLGRGREAAIFLALSLTGLALNDVIVWALAVRAGLAPNIAKVCATGVVMAYNFITRKLFLDAGEEQPHADA